QAWSPSTAPGVVVDGAAHGGDAPATTTRRGRGALWAALASLLVAGVAGAALAVTFTSSTREVAPAAEPTVEPTVEPSAAVSESPPVDSAVPAPSGAPRDVITPPSAASPAPTPPRPPPGIL